VSAAAAYHESGHAIVAYLLGYAPSRVSIAEDGTGSTRHRWSQHPKRSEWRCWAALIMAGPPRRAVHEPAPKVPKAKSPPKQKTRKRVSEPSEAGGLLSFKSAGATRRRTA